jgi:3-hydroxyacyl-[acyl-carrier-protein] dehydratase
MVTRLEGVSARCVVAAARQPVTGFAGSTVKFVLIDRILELESGKRITAQKSLSLAEEYLSEHFPKFPVLPGVLMLEAMVQASAWIVRERLDFAPSLVLLKEARNVTYKSFLSPGHVLTIDSECQSLSDDVSTFNAQGRVDDRVVVKARLTLRHLRLSATLVGWRELDERISAQQRTLFKLLWKGAPKAAAAAAPALT